MAKTGKTIKSIICLALAGCLVLEAGTGIRSVLASGISDKTAYELETEAADAKRKELEDAAAELLERVELLDPDKTDLELYILTMDSVYEDLFEELKRTERETEQANAVLDACRTDLEARKAYQEEKYRIMKDRIKYMYEEGNVSFTDVLFGSSGISDFFNRLEYRRRIMDYDRSIYDNYANAREYAENAEKLFAARLGEVEALSGYKETQMRTLEDLAKKKADELFTASNELSIETYSLFSHWDEIMEAADIGEVMEGIHSENEASYLLENIMWPLPGKSHISSRYGYRAAPIEGAATFHSGIDIPAETGTEAKAALSGVVVAASYDQASGNFVKISHGNGVYTSYCHASELVVKVGDHVKKGQTVVLVGSTGISTGPHLHFGVYVDGAYRDPLNYVWYGKE